MTYANVDLPGLDLGTSVTEAYWFEPLEDSTTRVIEHERRRRLEAVIDLSSADDSLDWDTLARIDIEGWGTDSTA
jgi:hypothetical protein